MKPIVRINRSLLTRELVATPRNRGITAKIVGEVVEDVINEARVHFQVELSNHRISKEIEGDIAASNISGTLGGVGNLFSFIGFKKGEKPIAFLKSFLFKKTGITKVILQSASRGRFIVKTNFPTKEEIFEKTPFHWNPGRSWLDGIEKGISGFQEFFMIGRGQDYFKSRSKGGLQSKGPKLRGGQYKPRPYFISMYKDFLKSLTKRR